MRKQTQATSSLHSLTKPRFVRFWGRRYRVAPCLVGTIFGDGKQIVWFEPLATRPDYYVVRVDSTWNVVNHEVNPLCGHLEEIYQAIETEFGLAVDTWEHNSGRQYTKHNSFPALHWDCGVSWGNFA